MNKFKQEALDNSVDESEAFKIAKEKYDNLPQEEKDSAINVYHSVMRLLFNYYLLILEIYLYNSCSFFFFFLF